MTKLSKSDLADGRICQRAAVSPWPDSHGYRRLSCAGAREDDPGRRAAIVIQSFRTWLCHPTGPSCTSAATWRSLRPLPGTLQDHQRLPSSITSTSPGDARSRGPRGRLPVRLRGPAKVASHSAGGRRGPLRPPILGPSLTHGQGMKPLTLRSLGSLFALGYRAQDVRHVIHEEEMALARDLVEHGARDAVG
jgi:hypothetical protein